MKRFLNRNTRALLPSRTSATEYLRSLIILYGILPITTTALSQCILFALSPAYAAVSESKDVGSRQTSTCSFLIVFRANESDLDGRDLSIISSAIRFSQEDFSHSITLSSTIGEGESSSLSEIREQKVEDLIKALSRPRNIGLRSTGPSTDRRASIPTVSLNICGPITPDEAQRTPPNYPNKTVRFDIGVNKIAVPIRYLNPVYWRDTPLDPVISRSLNLELGWPGLTDRLSPVMQHCTKFRDEYCNVNRIIISISSDLPYSRSAEDQVSQDVLSDVRSIGVVYGVHFFIKGERPGNTAYFRSLGNPLLEGYCTVGDLALMNVKQIQEYLQVELANDTRTSCHVHFSVSKSLAANVLVNGVVYSNLSNIANDVSLLVKSFVINAK